MNKTVEAFSLHHMVLYSTTIDSYLRDKFHFFFLYSLKLKIKASEIFKVCVRL